MNYIRELNAFRDWLMLNDLATSEVTLWYTLMSVDNMTGWQEWFTVPNSTLQQLAKLSKQGLDNARSALKSRGLIDYRKGSRKQAGSYKITSLVNSFDQSLDQSLYQKLDQSVDQDLPINKKRRKPNETKGNKPPISPKGESSKLKYADFVFMTEEQYKNLTELLGEDERNRFFLEFASWISGQTKRVQESRSAYLTILNWHRREKNKPKPINNLHQSQYQRTKSKLQEMMQEATRGEQAGNY